MGTTPISQPAFDKRISTLAFPLTGGQYGTIQRGFMVWEKAWGPYSGKAMVNFLYNPSSVEADYSMSNGGVASAYLFPTAFNDVDLRVPLNQTVEFSLLFDRTYEVQGTYNSNGAAGTANNPGQNDPRVVGVLADIMAMQQFTGMFTAYSTGNTGTTSPSPGALTGWQGILQLIPSYVYFGGGGSASTSLWYYGYITEWDVTVTHWTQYMIPMRCVMDITMTMLPPNGSTPKFQSVNGTTNFQPTAGSPTPYTNTSSIPSTGVSGR